jgi:hypothetical protein
LLTRGKVEVIAIRLARDNDSAIDMQPAFYSGSFDHFIDPFFRHLI